MAMCNLTALAIIDWKKIQLTVEYKILKGVEPIEALDSYFEFKRELDKVMNTGYVYFASDKAEDEFFALAGKYIFTPLEEPLRIQKGKTNVKNHH